ncbi:hypothetical protein L2E82_03950 [Cichorium intybus]|uniref:Uncharacterized protein n=1 Tax=Cichorium intybus TaxID=13427 RepID=A0ACB9H6W5_CICIN|nr:hypothetical protein L2E82_03950 [Cichorium intybus]
MDILNDSKDDRIKQIYAFDDAKSGVKGLIDAAAGALVINIGDLLQIVSNDKFKSVIHRAFINETQTRISAACFLYGVATPPKIYGPIKELVTKESRQVFREFTISDYMMKFYSRGLDEKTGLNYVRI